MALGSLLGDIVTLIKRDGRRFDRIRASVQRNKIFTNDTNVPIEEGDIFERALPNGIMEQYTVLDAGYRQGSGSIESHYQSVVQKQPKTSSTTMDQDFAKRFPLISISDPDTNDPHDPRFRYSFKVELDPG